MLDEDLQKKLIEEGRRFTRGAMKDDPYEEEFESDQERRLPQPPLCKAPVRPQEEWIRLPREFETLPMAKPDLLEAIRDRRSARVYTQEEMTVEQLAFLLWATQGVKGLRGKSYATLRTVPCGGARHEFETYLLVKNVTGLAAGIYHYLPLEHALEFLGAVENMDTAITAAMSGQSWCAKANVVFLWSMVPYRAEWRYGIYAHRIALIDAGHVGQNLYLACTGLGLGTCGIGAFDDAVCTELLGLDGGEEYIVYSAPVGTVREKDKAAEQAFYKFVEDEGL